MYLLWKRLIRVKWWWWLVIVIAFMVLTSIIGLICFPDWGQQFSANLLADVLVAIAIGVLIAQWQQRRIEARQKGEKTKKLLELLQRELVEVHSQVSQWLAKALEEGWIPTSPLPTAGWKSISSGPLLDAVPSPLLSPLLKTYTAIEEANGLLPLLWDLSVGLAQSLSTAQKNRARIREVMTSRCEEILNLVLNAIELLNTWIPEGRELAR